MRIGVLPFNADGDVCVDGDAYAKLQKIRSECKRVRLGVLRNLSAHQRSGQKEAVGDSLDTVFGLVSSKSTDKNHQF